VPERDDKQRRLPLSETDIRNVKQNLDRLGESDRLLFRVLAATGMRDSRSQPSDLFLNGRTL
jgi:integrase